MQADLHIHSSRSDGTDTPAQAALAAREAGVELIALTDHDTTAGIAECVAACRAAGMGFLTGVEISTGGSAEVHVLGYGVRPDLIEPRLLLARGDRLERMRAMTAKCRQAGLDVTLEEVLEMAAGAPPGRPHLALVLVRRGFASSVKNAFDRWLGDGRPCCVPRGRMPLREAIACIHTAGGAAVIAHPCLIRCQRRMLTQLLSDMLQEGADGIECWHSSHSPADAAEMASFARRKGALATGGSDYHGSSKAIRPGQGLAGWRTQEADLAALLARIAGHGGMTDSIHA